MKHFVYVIISQKRKYIYVGITHNLSARIARHNAGREVASRAYRPFKLIYNEKLSSRIDARIREKYLKSGVGKEFLKTLLW